MTAIGLPRYAVHLENSVFVILRITVRGSCRLLFPLVYFAIAIFAVH